MTTSRVIFLDDDQDLRDVFSELMSSQGVSVVAVASVAELEHVISKQELSFDLAILDINLGPEAPSGLDAYRWLKDHHFRGRTVFLTGHAHSHPLVSEAMRIGDASVHVKPVSIAELRAMTR